MSDWRDDAINGDLGSIFGIIADEVDPDFKKIEFIAFFDSGVIGYSYVVHDNSGTRIRVKAGDPVTKRSSDIRDLAKHFHATFVSNGENWVCFYSEIDENGRFSVKFSYNDPYEFTFAKLY